MSIKSTAGSDPCEPKDQRKQMEIEGELGVRGRVEEWEQGEQEEQGVHENKNTETQNYTTDTPHPIAEPQSLSHNESHNESHDESHDESHNESEQRTSKNRVRHTHGKFAQLPEPVLFWFYFYSPIRLTDCPN